MLKKNFNQIVRNGNLTLTIDHIRKNETVLSSLFSIEDPISSTCLLFSRLKFYEKYVAAFSKLDDELQHIHRQNRS